MARPYHFAPDSSRSPLDRRSASGFATGQAPSFKTNVNRAKTKRWVEAKSYTYDGDDWGDYDDDDQYGVEENQSLAPPKPTELRQKGQRLGSSPASSSRSSDQAGLNRSNSYERGDEQRVYPSGSQDPRTMIGANKSDESERSGGNDGSHSVLDYQKRRNFSPSILPQPLYAKSISATDEIPRKFPARKSSLMADEVPIEQAPHSNRDSTTTDSGDQEQPAVAAPGAPFIRPADIYKRMEAERKKERQSLDSQRSGSDRSPQPAIGGTRSLGQPLRSRSGSPSKARDHARAMQEDDLESTPAPRSVHESVNEPGPTSVPAIGFTPSVINSGLVTDDSKNGRAVSNTTQAGDRSSFLPQVHRLSGFGDDLWSSAKADAQGNESKTLSSPTEPSLQEAKEHVAVEEQQSQDDKSPPGYQAVVRQAFDRPDRSTLQTPLSAQESVDSHGVSRSNTDSTTGISPILSRMPSNPTAAKARAKEAELRAIATPPIGEESDQAQISTLLPSTIGGQRIPRKPASRAASGEYNATQIAGKPGSDVKLQSPRYTVANSLKVGQNGEDQDIVAAETEEASHNSIDSMSKDDRTLGQAMPNSKTPLTVDTEQNNRNSRIAARISDLSASSSKSPEVAVPRAESPTKGRVRDLAGRFNDGSSKRESSTSPSRSSVISLGKSKDDPSSNLVGQRNSAIWGISSDQNDPKRPSAQREASFRPNIPGRWESYSTSAGTPTPYEGDEPKGYLSGADAVGPRKAPEPSPLAQMEEEDDTEVDLTPKKTRTEAADKTSTGPDTLQMASLSQAGKAVGEAIKASVGLGSDSKQGGVDDNQDRAIENQSSVRVPTNEVCQRADSRRSSSSGSFNRAPVPPANDIISPDREDSDPFRAPEPLSVAGARRSKQTQSKILRRTEEKSLSDQNSDKLREEIEQTLSPAKSSESIDEGKSKSQQMPSHVSPGGSTVNRDSSVFPSEYDSYWANADTPGTENQSLTSPLGPITESATNQPGQDKELATPGPSTVHELPSYTVSDTKPKLSTRFSWETDQSSVAKAGAANDKTEVESRTPPKKTDSQLSPPSQFIEPSPEPPPKDAYEEVKSGKGNSADGELRSQMMSFGESSDPRTQTLSSSLGKEVTPGVPPKADSAAEAVSGLPPGLDGETDISDLASPNKEASNPSDPSSTTIQQLPSRTISSGSPLNQPAKQLSATWNPPPFREILAIKSPSERIQTCDRYRSQLITVDSGLNQWIRSTVATRPEHSKMVNNPYGQPLSVSTSFPATSAHEHGDSVPRLQSASTAGPTSANPIQYHPSPQSAGVAGSSARMSSQQVQARGKDLLHSANVFGGKASTISKGLFAKGRSRFKGGSSEKARSPSTEGAHERRRSLSFPNYRRSSRTSSLFMANADNERVGNDHSMSQGPPLPPPSSPPPLQPVLLSDAATSSANTTTAIGPPTDRPINHANAPHDHVATATLSTSRTHAKSITEKTATTPIQKAAMTPTHSFPSKRIRSFSPFRRRRSGNNNHRQSNPATGVLGDETNSDKKIDDDNDRSVRPGDTSRARSLSGGLLLLGRQMRFNQSGQGQAQQQKQQQQKGNQEKGQSGQEFREREFKERRRHSLFALPLSMSLPRSMSASNTQGTRKTNRAQTDALSQPLKYSPAHAHTYAHMSRQDDPWGWGEPPAESATGMQTGAGGGGGRRLMSDSSAVTVPARLGVLPSPPEAMFPPGVRERMGSPVEENKSETLEKANGGKDGDKVDGREGEGEGTDKDGQVNNDKVGDKALTDKSGRERKDTMDKEEEEGDFTMSGVWVKGQSVASPVEKESKGAEIEHFEPIADAQEHDDSQSFLGDLEGSKSRYDRMDESDSDLGNEIAVLSSKERVDGRDVGLVVLGTNRSEVNSSGEKVLMGKNAQLVERESLAGPLNSNPFSDGLYSEQINDDETTPTQARHLTIANPDILKSESLRSPILSPLRTNSAMTSPAISFHTATDGSVSQLETDPYGWEQASHDREIRQEEESTAEGRQESDSVTPQIREGESRPRNGLRSVRPGTEQSRKDRKVFQPSTTSPENSRNSHESNVPSPAPKPIFFKTNSTYYNPAGILASSSQARASRPSNSSDRSVERSHFVPFKESNDTRPGLFPKTTASDIFKALKKVSGGVGTRSALSGREKRRASIAGDVPMDPRRSPDAPPVPAINPAFLRNLHASNGQNGPRRAVTDSVALVQDKSSKRKSLTRVGNLFRRFSTKGPIPIDATTNNIREQTSTNPTKNEKHRSIAFMNRRSYTASPKDKPAAAPTSLGLDKRRASMPASVPTQSSWQPNPNTLPVETGRFGSSQYWEDMYRTSGLAFHDENNTPQQKQRRPQQRQSSDRQFQLNSKFRVSGNMKTLPNNPPKAPSQNNVDSTSEIADAYSNVIVRGHAVTPPRHGSALKQADSHLREMTPPLPTPPQAPALNLVPNAIPAPSLHTASTTSSTPAPLIKPLTSSDAQQWRSKQQQQQQQNLAPGLDAGNSSLYSQRIPQAEKSPVMHAASYPGMEWVPHFNDES